MGEDGADLSQAAERIKQLKKQTADLQKDLVELKSKPGCGG